VLCIILHTTGELEEGDILSWQRVAGAYHLFNEKFLIARMKPSECIVDNFCECLHIIIMNCCTVVHNIVPKHRNDKNELVASLQTNNVSVSHESHGGMGIVGGEEWPLGYSTIYVATMSPPHNPL
jgi:hypothetical protein